VGILSKKIRKNRLFVRTYVLPKINVKIFKKPIDNRFIMWYYKYKIRKGKVNKMFFLGWLIDIILTVFGSIFLAIYFGNSPLTFIFFCCFPIAFILIWCKIFEKRG
jgi:hypothetical protein